MIIKVTDYLDGVNAITAQDGQKVFNAICAGVNARGRCAIVDFAGVRIVAPPFLNAAIGQLYRNHDAGRIWHGVSVLNISADTKKAVRFVALNSQWFYGLSEQKQSEIRDIFMNDLDGGR